jgi:hypothetical protein
VHQHRRLLQELRRDGTHQRLRGEERHRDDLDRRDGNRLRHRGEACCFRGEEPWGEEFHRGLARDACPCPEPKRRGCCRGGERLRGAYPCPEPKRRGCCRGALHREPWELRVHLQLASQQEVQQVPERRQEQQLVSRQLVRAQRVRQVQVQQDQGSRQTEQEQQLELRQQGQQNQPWPQLQELRRQELASDPRPRERFAACGLQVARSWTMVP